MVDRSECGALLSQHVNVLIVGADREEIEAIVADVIPYTYSPRFTWPDVPALTPGIACTVIVRGLIKLSAVEQEFLQKLLNQRICPLQIVSTAASTVFDEVERGAFPATLYYRLNVLLLGRPDSHDGDGARYEPTNLGAWP
jgi:hypothetical protein